MTQTTIAEKLISQAHDNICRKLGNPSYSPTASEIQKEIDILERVKSIEWTRVSNDVNGNPRYVCHYPNLLTKAENNDTSGFDFVSRQYQQALNRAKKLGGRKFNNKQYGGGIVFQSYNIAETEKQISELLSAVS